MKLNFSEIVWNIIVNVIAKSILINPRIRYLLYRVAGMRTRTNNIRSGCIFRGKSVFLEKGVFLNHNVFIDAWEKVTIKENVAIAFNVSIITSSHKVGLSSKRAGKSIRKPVIIERGCWVGASSTILGGVTIGEGCVIAAGSVVTHSCEPNSLYAGVPAKKIKELPEGGLMGVV